MEGELEGINKLKKKWRAGNELAHFVCNWANQFLHGMRIPVNLILVYVHWKMVECPMAALEREAESASQIISLTDNRIS